MKFERSGLWECSECSTVCFAGVSFGSGEDYGTDYDDARGDMDQDFVQDVGMCQVCRRCRAFYALWFSLEDGKVRWIPMKVCPDCEWETVGNGPMEHLPLCPTVSNPTKG